MGLLNEFFLARNDDDARRALPDGPTAGGFVEVVAASGLTNLQVELIEQAVTGRAGAPAGIGVLSIDDAPEGPWVIGFPSSVTDALLDVGEGQLEAVADRWVEAVARQGADPSSLSGLLVDLVDLASTGASSSRAPYLWICL